MNHQNKMETDSEIPQTGGCQREGVEWKTQVKGIERYELSAINRVRHRAVKHSRGNIANNMAL